MEETIAEPLLRVIGQKKYFTLRRGILVPQVVCRAVDGVSFHIDGGEIFGLVGESGSGKTTLAKCIMGLIEPTAGEIFFQGRNILRLGKREWKGVRRQMQIIFQDPYGSLDGRMSVGAILAEPYLVHCTVRRKQIKDRVMELLRLVGMHEADIQRFPHELSGGQRQRVAIARAIALTPRLVVADEPFSALDISIQGQIANLLLDLQARFNLAYLFVSHDLRMIRNICDRVAVMHQGKIVETGPTAELFRAPRHPHTRSLVAAADAVC